MSVSQSRPGGASRRGHGADPGSLAGASPWSTGAAGVQVSGTWGHVGRLVRRPLADSRVGRAVQGQRDGVSQGTFADPPWRRAPPRPSSREPQVALGEAVGQPPRGSIGSSFPPCRWHLMPAVASPGESASRLTRARSRSCPARRRGRPAWRPIPTPVAASAPSTGVVQRKVVMTSPPCPRPNTSTSQSSGQPGGPDQELLRARLLGGHGDHPRAVGAVLLEGHVEGPAVSGEGERDLGRAAHGVQVLGRHAVRAAVAEA